MASKEFSKEDLKAMLYGDSRTLEEVTREAGDKGRWHTCVDVIFCDATDGKLYRTSFREAATEYQDHEYPDGGPCPEVREVEKVVKVYENVNG